MLLLKYLGRQLYLVDDKTFLCNRASQCPDNISSIFMVQANHASLVLSCSNGKGQAAHTGSTAAISHNLQLPTYQLKHRAGDKNCK